MHRKRFDCLTIDHPNNLTYGTAPKPVNAGGGLNNGGGEVYPEIKMELVLRPGTFGPEMVDQLSQELNVPKNYMFIGHPGQKFPHNIADLGGVRLII